MTTYFWDAGIIIGYVIWVGDEYEEVVTKIDPLAKNCDNFVHNKAKNHENFIPANSHHEVDSRIKKNYATFSALIDFIKKSKFNPDFSIDVSRLFSLKEKLSSIDKLEAIKVLIKIQSVIQGRWIQINKICNIRKYFPRIEKKYELLMEQKLQKRGDLLNYSSAIHFNNKECECIFITTDKKDFGNLNLSSLGIPYKFPSIEFVQDY